MTNSPDYEVGYGRPPRQHQFPLKVSGNPSGQRSADKRARAALDKALNQTVPMVIGGNEIDVPVDEAKVWRLVSQALNGSLKSIRALFFDHWLKYDVLPVLAAQSSSPIIEAPAGMSLTEVEHLVQLHGRPPWSDAQVATMRKAVNANNARSAT